MTQIEKSALPPGWTRVSIAAIVSTKRGRATKKWARDTGTIRLIFSGDLRNQKAIGDSERPVDSLKTTEQVLLDEFPTKTLEKIRQDLFVPSNSVLLAQARDNAGFVGMHRSGEAVVNNAVLAMAPKTSIIHPELLFYYFKNPRIRLQIQRSLMPSGKTFVTKQDILALSINLPPRVQQDQMVQQIEALLSGAEQVQTLLQKNQSLMDQLLESALREIFTAERKNVWKKGKLGDLVTVQNGQEDLRQQQYQDYPFIEADDIDRTIGHVRIYPKRAESTLPISVRGTLLDKDLQCIVYAFPIAVGDTWIRRVAMPYYQHETPPERLRCKDDLVVFTVKDPVQLHPRFLFWALQDPGAEVSVKRKKSGAKKKQEQFVSTLSIPDLDEQKNISAYLDAYQEQLIQMKTSHQASQFAVDQMEGSILDQIFREE